MKILVGIAGGYLVREIASVGVDAFKNPFVLFLILLFVFGSIFLVVRHCTNRGRKAEITDELNQLNEQGRL